MLSAQVLTAYLRWHSTQQPCLLSSGRVQLTLSSLAAAKHLEVIAFDIGPKCRCQLWSGNAGPATKELRKLIAYPVNTTTTVGYCMYSHNARQLSHAF